MVDLVTSEVYWSMIIHVLLMMPYKRQRQFCKVFMVDLKYYNCVLTELSPLSEIAITLKNISGLIIFKCFRLGVALIV
jgi:hypothetical protein